MMRERYQKFFGIGPLGALISVSSFFGVWLLNQRLGHPQILSNPEPLQYAAAALFIFGFALHLWTFVTLRKWWQKDALCSGGPFRVFRHPMYAAWVSFISMAVALALNSWLLIFWSLGLHPFWHWLVRKEEKWMEQFFGSNYSLYAKNTGRFFPRIFKRRP